MTPQEQITALMAGVADEPPDLCVPCKKNKTHKINILVRWADDLTPVPTAAFEIFRGKTSFADDSVAKGKYGQKNVPPGNYRIFFPEIDQSEIEQE